MSKRREDYQKGIDRLCGYLDILLKEKTKDEDGLWKEIKAIRVLGQMQVEIDFHTLAENKEDEFFFLLREEYRRYDDVLPERVSIQLIPGSHDDPKKLDQLTTLNP